MMFMNFDEGIGTAIPSFLFPEKEVEYYNGTIPEFKHEILNKDFGKTYSKFLLDNLKPSENVALVQEAIEIKHQENEISDIEYYDGKMRIKYYDGFYLYDMIWIDEFVKMKNSYEKACIAEALTNIPNENDQILDSLKDMHKDYMDVSITNIEDEFCYVEKELNLFKKIDEFLSLEKRMFKKEKIKNKISKEIIKHCYLHKNFLKDCYSEMMKEESAYNIGTKFIIEFDRDDLEDEIQIEKEYEIDHFLNTHGFLQREETDFYLELDQNLEVKKKHLKSYGSTTFKFNEKLNKLLMLWSIGEMQSRSRRD